MNVYAPVMNGERVAYCMRQIGIEHELCDIWRLEKKNVQRRVIHSLLSEAGKELSEAIRKIRKRAVDYYSEV